MNQFPFPYPPNPMTPIPPPKDAPNLREEVEKL